MDTAQVRDTLEQLRRQRTILDSAIAGLENFIASFDNEGASRQSSDGNTKGSAEPNGNSYIDQAIAALRQHGSPLHIKELCVKIGELRGTEPLARASVESSLVRHISKSKQRRVVRTGPSRYGLPEWKQSQQPTVIEMAS